VERSLSGLMVDMMPLMIKLDKLEDPHLKVEGGSIDDVGLR